MIVENNSKPPIVWHGHHQAKFPIEILGETFENRLCIIETVKLQEENPQKIAWRKKLFKLVIGLLPEAVQQAMTAYQQAFNDRWQAIGDYYQIYDLFWQAKANYKEVNAADQQIYDAYRQTDAAYEKAKATCQQVIKDHLPEIMALHAVECGCPWTPENNNIFDYMPNQF
jgi:hypothetical protein